MCKCCAILAAAVAVLLGAAAYADVPQLINYQGRLTDADGKPIDGERSITFAFYDVEAGGELLCDFRETQTVTITNGVFNVLIGSATVGGVPQSVFAGADVYLSVTVEGEEQTPRQRVGSVPFAFKSANAEALEARVAALENLLSNVYRNGNTIVFNELNVQIVNGADATDSEANGLGNLIVGYNEERKDGTDDRSGSHNIIVGKQNSFSSWGGVVAGLRNTVSAPYASVKGGSENIASGSYSSVSGGCFNTASGEGASVAGGGGADIDDGNTAFADYSAILGGSINFIGDALQENHYIGRMSTVGGGTNNTVRGTGATVSGGYSNLATGSRAAVGGGCVNTAGGSYSFSGGGYKNATSGTYASITGGNANTTSGYCASVSGGRNNTASGEYSSVAGGGSENSAYGNHAFGHYTAILGGQNNLAGDPDLVYHNIGQGATVSGGSSNEATGTNSSVSGGNDNIAMEDFSAVSGGFSNTTSGIFSTVSGGRYNEASGDSASVSGGEGNIASGKFASVTGGRDNEAAGESCSVTGGSSNQAGQWYSSNDCASVSGGLKNKATGDHSSVSGGNDNTAQRSFSSVSGGSYVTAGGVVIWRAGNLWMNTTELWPICTELEVAGAGGAP